MWCALVVVLLIAAANPLAKAQGGNAATQTDTSAQAAADRVLAEQGNAEAQDNLGLMYRDAKGVPQDYAEAVRWFRKAAEQGNAGAQAALGGMYLSGWGVTKDYGEAVRWFRKSADQGNRWGQNGLG
jgi:hypothetical protein